MPSVYTIEGAGRRRRKKKRKGGSPGFKAANRRCRDAGIKPFTKAFGSCMKRELGR